MVTAELIRRRCRLQSERPLVLVVEDEPEVVHACELRLRASGFAVEVARDGDEAVVKAHADAPDAIIMDVRMPKKDGLEALSELKHCGETRGIPVIMLSACLNAEEACLRGGARFFLRKPYRCDLLIAAVRAVTEDRGTSGETAPAEIGDESCVESRLARH